MFAPKNKNRNPKARKGPEATRSKSTEPVWNFDDDNDPLTIVCQEMTEAVMINPSVDMASYATLVENSSSDMNKSDVCLLVLGAITCRIGMQDMSNRFLSESDSVNAMFNSLNLSNTANLNMFCTMLGILAPEILKTIESSIFASMRRLSGKNSAMHSLSRVESAMRQAAYSKVGTEAEFDTSTVLAGAARPSRIRFVAQSMLEGVNEDTILVEDSASAYGKSPTQRKVNIGRTGLILDEEGLRQIAKESPTEKLARLRQDYPESPEPVMAKANVGRTGLGFSEMMKAEKSGSKSKSPSTSPESAKSFKSKGKARTSSATEKIQHLEAGLLGMQLDEENQSDEGMSIML